MTAASPGSRVCTNEQASLSKTHLQSAELKRSLEHFLDICKTSYGPRGQLKVVHNGSGGHVTVSSSSSRLLQTISVSKPVLKLITSAIMEHIKFTHDGGLFVAIFSTGMVLSVVNKTLNARLCIDLNDHFLGLCVEYLESSLKSCKLTVNWDTTESVTSLIRSIVSSKPGCILSRKALDHISRLLLRAFLQTYAVDGRGVIFHTINFMEQIGPSSEETSLVDGIMFETPQIPTYKKMPPLKEKLTRDGDKVIRVAIINVSMAGDSEEYEEARYELNPDMDMASLVEKRIIVLARRLMEDNVGIVACQKVVSPSVKKILRENGVLVLDRLALTFTSNLLQFAGGRMISSIQTVPDTRYYGVLSAAYHKVIGGKSYLNLVPLTSTGSCTMIVTSPSEEAAAELKAVSKCAVQTLKTLLVKPQALCGGGCWQTNLTFYLAQKVTQDLPRLSASFGCTKLQAREVIETFCHNLLVSATKQLTLGNARYIDNTYGHLWTTEKGERPSVSAGSTENLERVGVSCQCRAITCDRSLNFTDITDTINFPLSVSHSAPSDYKALPEEVVPKVLDCFQTATNSLKNAVAISNMVIGIDQFIHDGY